MDSNGRIDGRKPIFNDVLACLWCKMSRCGKDPLLKACSDFYDADTISAARDLLHASVPSDKRRTKHRSKDDILNGIYAEFQSYPTESEYLFVALNLINIPCTSLASIDGATLVYKQTVLNNHLNEILNENKEMKNELKSIKALLSEMRPQANSTMPENSQNLCRPTSQSSVNLNFEPPPPPPPPPPQSYREVLGRVPTAEAVSRQRPPSGSGVPNRGGSFRRGAPSRRSFSAQRQNNIQNGRENNQVNVEEALAHGPWITINRRQNQNSRLVTGRKPGNSLGVVPKVKMCRVFISRLSPGLSTETFKTFCSQFIDEDFEVLKLAAKFPNYSSFVISCDEKHKQKLFDPENWEEGTLIRPYFGALNRPVVENP